MPAQIIPIQDVASAGVIKDTPSITLPPNVYSDVSNVRFHSGAVRKMEGEEAVTLEALDPAVGNIIYTAYWQSPAGNYYIVVETDGDVYVFDDNGDHVMTDTGFEHGGTEWQHTLFNGGFNLVMNNGVDVPRYFSATDVLNESAPLPNWDSYLAQEEVTTVVWDEFNTNIVLGRAVDFGTESILYSVTPRDTSIGIINYTQSSLSDSLKPYTLVVDDAENFEVTPRPRSETQTGALPGDLITISIQTKASIAVRAGVIRAYGNLLVAGNLTEMNGTEIVRRLPGTIRTSDVAAPGQIPLNWNPFRNGANTADEFILSSTGVVQDMAELQGVMYVYTDVSIHAIQQTGNQAIPFQISTTTDSYGANSLGAVMEFDGRHLVVGSQDIYVFAGHPGSISSIADGRVRHYAYGTDSELDTSNVRMVRNQKYDEIWMFTPGLTQMFVWNYRNQAWTIRNQSTVTNGGKGPDGPIFWHGPDLFMADAPGKFTKHDHTEDDSSTFMSYVERLRLPLTPEFTTETIGSTALWYSSSRMIMDDAPTLTITMEGTNKPAIEEFSDKEKTFMFLPKEDYKVDTRIQGRFMNYKVSDDSAIFDWNLTGYQFEVMQGGKR